METADYSEKLEQQIAQYRTVENIHELPEIFHYWSNKYLRPRLNAVGAADSIAGFYAEHFLRAATGGAARFLSLGAGDCAVEIEVARELRNRGLDDFEIECLELSPVLMDRARQAISAQNLEEYLTVKPSDLNAWSPGPELYNGIMANHSLHHLVSLESIFEGVSRGLAPRGIFVTNDMIGRNGHMRWPEVLHYVDLMWAFLPDRLKYNHQFARLDKRFVNWDCSNEGFEGIRAQDILPQLVRKFEFTHFLAYGGVIDVFVDRGYGHNFDAKDPADRAFVDFVQEINDQLTDAGVIKPTMMFAVMATSGGGAPVVHRRWTPEFCVRPPG